MVNGKAYCTLIQSEKILLVHQKCGNNYGAIKFIILFSITPCKAIAINLLSLIFGVSSLFLFLIALSKVGKAITIWVAIQKKAMNQSKKHILRGEGG